MAIRFDDSEWPLLVIRFLGRDDDASISSLLSGLTHHVQRGRCAVVVDTSGTVYPSFADATRFGQREAEWLRDHRDVVARNVCGAAFIIDNPALRFVLSTIFLTAPLPSPHLVTVDVNEGRTWCVAQLRARPRSSMRPAKVDE